MVEDAKANGAKIHAGGNSVPGPGFFYRPTILTNVSADMAIVREEQFGPALPVIAYRDLEDAVAQANDTKFGLGASVWGSDPAQAANVVQRLNAGLAWVNSYAEIIPARPSAAINPAVSAWKAASPATTNTSTCKSSASCGADARPT